jgi:hypothetical protein
MSPFGKLVSIPESVVGVVPSLVPEAPVVPVETGSVVADPDPVLVELPALALGSLPQAASNMSGTKRRRGVDAMTIDLAMNTRPRVSEAAKYESLAPVT